MITISKLKLIIGAAAVLVVLMVVSLLQKSEKPGLQPALISSPMATLIKRGEESSQWPVKKKEAKPTDSPTPLPVITSLPIPSPQVSNSPSLVNTSSPTSTPISIPSTFSPSTPPNNGASRILLSEVMVGAKGNTSYEFVEIYNAGSGPADLSGWTVKKKSSSGSESALVSASRLNGKIVPAGHYFLLANESGYTGAVIADVTWPSSYTLAYTKNTVTIYNKNGETIDALTWAEIPEGQSESRVSWDSNNFSVGSPTPQNSASN